MSDWNETPAEEVARHGATLVDTHNREQMMLKHAAYKVFLNTALMEMRHG